ncbi:hypothetical protein Q1695_010600 [Nippostrongylus brasiliensis]|nr:hypothetical protein Q1695_010600 [Nippostrongylus brasiliensis]
MVDWRRLFHYIIDHRSLLLSGSSVRSMKSLLLIVGFALALAAPGKKKECGYTVVRGPNPSECDKRWRIPWSGNSYGFLNYHNWPMKVFYTKGKITWEQAKSLCGFHCSIIGHNLGLTGDSPLELGLNSSYPVWVAARNDANQCYVLTVNSQHGWVSNMADCGSRQHGVLCAKDQL